MKSWGGALEPLFGDVGGGGAVMVGTETPQDGEGALQPIFGAAGGGGVVMVGMETPQDGEGDLCSPQLVLCVESGSEVGGL